MALKESVNKRIMGTVIRPHQSKEWKVLIVDHLSMRTISSCCKMSDIMSQGITLVEDICKKREPMTNLDAIYLLTPMERSIRGLINDFTPPGVLYRTAHVYVTEAVPDDLMEEVSKSSMSKYIKTFTEINIAFVPYESQVFSLDTPETFQYYYNPNQLFERNSNLERSAEQLATLCSVLGEYPTVYYRSDYDFNAQFAKMVQEKLDYYKNEEPSMGQGAQKERSVLLILDRGFDPVSPLLHELTYQAAVYDLLPIENDVYKYEAPSGNDVKEKEVLLDENDDLWVELRHQHMAIVSTQVTKQLKSFQESKRMKPDKNNMKDLSQMIKKMPQYQKELNNYATHLRLAEDVMRCYQSHVVRLCKAEQDIAVGTTVEGERIRDHMRNIVPLLLDETVAPYDKLRVIMLYIVNKGGETGITEENMHKLVSHGQIPLDERAILTNMALMGLPIACDQNQQLKFDAMRRRAPPHYKPENRKERMSEASYQVSRWIPYIKDIMEEITEERLDYRKYPPLKGGGTQMQGGPQMPTSARPRYGQWHRDRATAPTGMKGGPRIIIFVVGGITFSEMRCAYEVSNEHKPWEVIIGGTNILTPESFLENVRRLSVSTNNDESKK